MRGRSSDLLGVAVAATAALALSLADAGGAARVALAMTLAFVLPGYALCAAAFPARTLGAAEQVVFSLGVSLAVSALGGLVLNWTPLGLQAGSWALLLTGVTLGASVVALLRRQAHSVAASGPRASLPALREGLLFGLAVLVVAGAVAASNVGAAQSRAAGFTQLWILPIDEADQRLVRFGVSSQELATTQYRLRVEIGGESAGEWPAIELRPGDQWESGIELPAGEFGAGLVKATLYLAESPDVAYRRVTLSLDRGSSD